ncbi:DUF2690 domain-containing protein [Kitasatospora sp. NPDC059673]|uniref:DUF2690 domain-containing protein n=1 Tax=Kitasatospora sp. NPDC059673 TaxID=3346901 RepID=UPI0036A61984
MPHSRPGEPAEEPGPSSTPARPELARLLRQWRRDAGDWSQSTAARKAGLAQGTLSRYETGAQLAPDRVVRLLARHYRRPESDLVHALALCTRAEQEGRGPVGAEPATAVAGGEADASAQPNAAPGPETGRAPAGSRRRLRALAGVLAAALIGGGLTLALRDGPPTAGRPGPSAALPPAPEASAPSAGAIASCAGESCVHVEPTTTVCQNDAVTTDRGREFGVLVELRYSAGCRAVWARMDGGSPGDRIQVFGTEGDPPEQEEYRQQSGHTAHTKMVRAGTSGGARACAMIDARGTFCATPLPEPDRAGSVRTVG